MQNQSTWSPPVTGIRIVDETFPTIHALTPIFPATLLSFRLKWDSEGGKAFEEQPTWHWDERS